MTKNIGEKMPEAPTGSDAEVDGVLQTLATITDPKDRLIEELRNAVRSRDDFLAIAAHELRNPLTPILLCVQLIRVAQEADNRAKCVAELDRLERLVKHFASRAHILLEVAQITAKKFQLHPCKLNLSELVTSIVNDYMPLVDRSGSVLTASISENVDGYVDRMAVAEIVENLLTNAIKYGQRKPIELVLSATDDLAELIVRDYGIGIANEDKERIFNRFERAVDRDVHSGFGIGLWLVRNLAESMGGSIAVIGEPGAGSTFKVSLPIKSQGNR